MPRSRSPSVERFQTLVGNSEFNFYRTTRKALATVVGSQSTLNRRRVYQRAFRRYFVLNIKKSFNRIFLIEKFT